jgi:hypothetical protein
MLRSGVEIGGDQLRAGDRINLPEAQAVELIRNSAAEIVTET